MGLGGGTHPVTVRWVAATIIDLRALVGKMSFPEDIYSRLASREGISTKFLQETKWGTVSGAVQELTTLRRMSIQNPACATVTSMASFQFRIFRRAIVPVLFAPPAKRQIDDRPRQLSLVKSAKRLVQYRPLLLPVARLSQRMTKGPAQKDCTRWPDLFRVFPDDRNADRRNPPSFNFSLDQSHGLIADPSSRCQQNHVDLVSFQSSGDLVRRPLNQCCDMPPIDMPHERVMSLGQTADDPFINKLLHTI